MGGVGGCGSTCVAREASYRTLRARPCIFNTSQSTSIAGVQVYQTQNPFLYNTGQSYDSLRTYFHPIRLTTKLIFVPYTCHPSRCRFFQLRRTNLHARPLEALANPVTNNGRRARGSIGAERERYVVKLHSNKS